MWKKVCDGQLSTFPGSNMEERYKSYRNMTCESDDTLRFLKETGLEKISPGAMLQV